MEFKSIKELVSCKGIAYDGELVQRCTRMRQRDWDALKEYAQREGTSAGEIVRELIRDFLAGVETRARIGED